ncbi:sulfate adenylyltransferase subunit CysD [Alphaproteobacteria bacterium]|nr:sulfate adenylyltransferase subunit CysD [Alphaproteobacteria bacterium]
MNTKTDYTLFFKTNPSLKSSIWDSESHFMFLHHFKIFNTKRSYERWIEKENIFPKSLTTENFLHLFDSSVNASLLKNFLKQFENKRNLIIYLQLIKYKNKLILFGNDRRGGKKWALIKSLNVKELRQGLILLTRLINKNCVFIPSPDLIEKLKEFSLNDHYDLIISKKLKLHLPFYIYKNRTLKINETKTSNRFKFRKNSYLNDLENESINIIREVVSEASNPVMLYSIGKDSSVMLHLAKKAFYPSSPPFPLLHVDTRWKFQEMYQFRDLVSKQSKMELQIHINQEGIKNNINPFDHGSSVHTDIMKTQGLKQALDYYQYDAAFGGARRDEEKSRAKERIFSFRTSSHQWNPKNQRPELWNLFNTKITKGESIRVFPLSNWTEQDIWQYIYQENIPLVPLYFAKLRPVIKRDGMWILVDDNRLNIQDHEKIVLKKVRFRTLGCYPLTGAIESEADNLESIVLELLQSKTSEREGRAIDADSSSSMEKKKIEGYF